MATATKATKFRENVIFFSTDSFNNTPGCCKCIFNSLRFTIFCLSTLSMLPSAYHFTLSDPREVTIFLYYQIIPINLIPPFEYRHTACKFLNEIGWLIFSDLNTKTVIYWLRNFVLVLPKANWQFRRYEQK